MLLFAVPAGAQAAQTDIPEVFHTTMMLPYPWCTLTKVVVIRLQGEDMVMLSDFHAKILHSNGPMPVSMDVLRLRLSRISSGQVICDQSHHPMVIPLLKQHSAVQANAARAKLVSLPVMESALQAAGMRPDHVSAIINTYWSVSHANESQLPAQAAPEHLDSETTTLLPLLEAAAANAGPDVVHSAADAQGHVDATPAGEVAPIQTAGTPATTQAPAAAAATAAAATAATTATPSAMPAPPSAAQVLQALIRHLDRIPVPHPSGQTSATSANKRSAPSATEEVVLARDWPSTLPELAFPPKALKDNYSLNTILPGFREDKSIVLGRQLDAFKAWCTAPVHMGRGTDYPNPVANITYEGCEAVVLGFMGFMLKVSH